MSKIYLSAKLPELGTNLLKEAGLDYQVYEGIGLISKKELIKNISDCEVLICPYQHRLIAKSLMLHLN
ncbi:hypothetical protein ABW365_17445 [Enterococcus avium]